MPETCKNCGKSHDGWMACDTDFCDWQCVAAYIAKLEMLADQLCKRNAADDAEDIDERQRCDLAMQLTLVAIDSHMIMNAEGKWRHREGAGG